MFVDASTPMVCMEWLRMTLCATQEQLEVVNPRARIQLTADFAGPAAGSSSL